MRRRIKVKNPELEKKLAALDNMRTISEKTLGFWVGPKEKKPSYFWVGPNDKKPRKMFVGKQKK